MRTLMRTRMRTRMRTSTMLASRSRCSGFSLPIVLIAAIFAQFVGHGGVALHHG